MRPGSVIVDVAIDQGGCIETSRSTTWVDPTRVVSDVVHFGVLAASRELRLRRVFT